MPDTPSPAATPPAPPPTGPGTWFGGSRLVWIVAILAGAGLAAFFGLLSTCRRGIETAERGMVATGETIQTIAEAFRPERITQTFAEFADLKVKGTEGNILEVATAEAKESFTRVTNLMWFERVVPFGTTVSEISVPATYRFHIDLRGPWDLAAYDGRVVVVAPPIQPSLPVAFDSARMEKKTTSGWARWDGEEHLQELEASLTAQLATRAQAPATLGRVREESRLAVAKFVKNWLAAGRHWGEETYREIVVVFPDEIGQAGAGSLSTRPATLRWEASDRSGQAPRP